MGSERTNKAPSRKPRGTEILPDRADFRRAEYHSDEGVADAKRASERQRYRGGAQAPARTPASIVGQGTVREINHPSDPSDGPIHRETFTIPEAARALGRPEVTFRRWIAADKIPAPYLNEAGRELAVYSIGELQVIQQVLQRHEADYQYMTEQSGAVSEMHEYMHAYRAHNI